MPNTPPWLRRARRIVVRRRRLIISGLLATAVVCIVQLLAPPAPATDALYVAARDLPAGAHLTLADIRQIDVRDASAFGDPVDAADLVGRVVAAPMSDGEPFSETRLLGRRLLDGYGDGVVAVPIRLNDAGVIALLRVGARVNVLAATGDESSSADLVATAAPIVSMPASDDTGLRQDGGLVVVALDEDEAARVAQAAATTQLSVTLLD